MKDALFTCAPLSILPTMRSSPHGDDFEPFVKCAKLLNSGVLNRNSLARQYAAA